jgi:hypothetical protein
MASELLGNDVNGDAGLSPAFDLAAFVQIELGVGALHE